MFVDYVQSLAPDCVEVKVTPMHGGEGYVCPITLPAYRAAEEGFTEAFGKRPLAVRRGGSIPIISDFERVLGVKTVLMGSVSKATPSIRPTRTSVSTFSAKASQPLWVSTFTIKHK